MPSLSTREQVIAKADRGHRLRCKRRSNVRKALRMRSARRPSLPWPGDSRYRTRATNVTEAGTAGASTPPVTVQRMRLTQAS